MWGRIKELQNNKSPGSDGLTTNFYNFFFIDIKELLYQSYLYSYKNDSLSTYQNVGILNLAPRDGKNCRPITLLITDY